MNNKPHPETTLDDYKAYAYHIREDAKDRGVENTRLSIYGIYMAVIEKQAAEIAALREALEPFAKLADEFSDLARMKKFDITDESKTTFGTDKHPVTVGDLRLAARALKGAKE